MTPGLDTAGRAAVMKAAHALAPEAYPNAVVSMNSRGQYALWPHGIMGSPRYADSIVWRQDWPAPRPVVNFANWPALRGAWVLASKIGAGVKAASVRVLTFVVVVVFVFELLLLDYLRELGGAPAERNDLARKVRASMTAYRIAAFMSPRGFGFWPSLGLFTLGVGASLWLHLAAFLWLVGGTMP